MKKVHTVRDAPPGHWVGDGFPVRSMFSYNGDAELMSPFLLLDHAGPADFPAGPKPRGVGQHPHRGFETVTIVYHGEVSHRDSAGNGGTIGPGDVQWMTAASGIIHEEFHSEKFTRAGGTLEMAQLWVNLPAAHKMSPPAYQSLLAADIPAVELPNGAGTLRVIAGEFEGHNGPARTFTPLNVWDLRLSAGKPVELPAHDGRTTALVVLHGAARVNGSEVYASQMVLLERSGTGAQVEAIEDSVVLWLDGVPIEEPVAGYGPFVMNSRSEIEQAVRDFNSGRFGEIPA
ncbi:MAG: pirin family protein [Xanthomonadaceae bacterium]|nr:pirin family protein [Xanthomonadaceae bacterium]